MEDGGAGMRDDEYVNIINKLKSDGAFVKGERMRKRMMNLESMMPEFSKFAANRTKMASDFEDFEESSNQVSNLMKNLSGIERDNKQNMCSAKIISLKDLKNSTKEERTQITKSNLSKNDAAIEERVQVVSG
jgi:hypothetical protein